MMGEIIKRVYNLNEDQQRDLRNYLRTLQKHQRREYPRITYKINIDAVIDDKVIQSETRDISACGVFINTTDEIEIGKDAKVVFKIPDYNNTFRLKGIVVRTEQEGIAIKFNNMTPYSKRMLNELLLKIKSDSDIF